jgi:hypothetical protein
MKEEIDVRAAKLRLTRTDYLRLLVMADLDKGDAPLVVERHPTAEVKKSRSPYRWTRPPGSPSTESLHNVNNAPEAKRTQKKTKAAK